MLEKTKILDIRKRHGLANAPPKTSVASVSSSLPKVTKTTNSVSQISNFQPQCSYKSQVNHAPPNGPIHSQPSSASQPNYLLPYETKVHSRMMCLKNIGNSCYIGATIQSLLSLPKFHTDIINVIRTLDLNNHIEYLKLVTPLLKLVRAREQCDASGITRSMYFLRRDLQETTKRFDGDSHQDALDFFYTLLDVLDKELLQLFLQGPSLVDKIFQSKRVEIINCLHCLKTKENFHVERAFTCSLTSNLGKAEVALKLEDLMEDIFETDQVREYNCEVKEGGCGHDNAIITSRLVDPPRVLVINIRRSDYVFEDQTKIEDEIVLPSILDLTPYVSGVQGSDEIEERLYPGSAEAKPVYRLTSVINHHGSNTEVGHYTADVFSYEDNQWLRYNDSVLERVAANLESKNAYIVMYVMESDVPINSHHVPNDPQYPRNDTKEDVSVHQTAVIKNNPKKSVSFVAEREVFVGDKGDKTLNYSGPESSLVKSYTSDREGEGYRSWFNTEKGKGDLVRGSQGDLSAVKGVKRDLFNSEKFLNYTDVVATNLKQDDRELRIYKINKPNCSPEYPMMLILTTIQALKLDICDYLCENASDIHAIFISFPNGNLYRVTDASVIDFTSANVRIIVKNEKKMIILSKK